MPKRTGPTNPLIVKLVADLKQKGHADNIPFLIDIAEKLEVSRRQKHEVDLSTLERVSNDNETIIVPGKVLATGIIKKKLNIAAANFSGAAVDKISKAGGKVMTIEELIKTNPKGTNVRIVI